MSKSIRAKKTHSKLCESRKTWRWKIELIIGTLKTRVIQQWVALWFARNPFRFVSSSSTVLFLSRSFVQAVVNSLRKSDFKLTIKPYQTSCWMFYVCKVSIVNHFWTKGKPTYSVDSLIQSSRLAASKANSYFLLHHLKCVWVFNQTKGTSHSPVLCQIKSIDWSENSVRCISPILITIFQ